MKQLFIILIFCACSPICTAANGSAQQESKQNPSTLTIRVGSSCGKDDTIQIDSAALRVFSQNLLEKRQYGVELDSLDARIDALSAKKNGLAPIPNIIWLIILTLGLILLYFFHFVKRRDYIVDTVKTSRRVNRWILSMMMPEDSSAYQNTNPSRNNYDALQKRIEKLEKKIKDLEDQKESALSQQKEAANPPATRNRESLLFSSVRRYYAESIQDNRYVKVKETQTDDAIFEITVKPDKSAATVTVCKNAFRKVLANPSFLDGCDKQVSGNTTVIVEEEGTAERTDDNKWVIRKQIKVALR